MNCARKSFVAFSFSIFAAALTGGATTYNVGDNSALTAALATVNPGDSIVMSNGNYSGVSVTRSGTAANPITISAANQGQAVINSGIFTLMNVSYVTVQGLNFTNLGASIAVDGTSDKMLLGLIGATNCRITRCTFDPSTNSLPNNTFFTYLNGTCLSNRIDHCEYGWYTNGGDHAIRTSGTVAIAGVTAPFDRMPWALGYGPYNPNMARYTWIDHNYLHDHYTPGASGGETIQLGAIGDTGDYQNLYTLVEYNLFVSCSGDPEIISVKSSNNTMRYNTVRTSAAVFSLRAGNNDSVYGNFFLCGGAGGGIKMCERDHKIFNNYIENSDTSSYPIMLESGNLYDVAFAHAQVVRAQIVHNTVVNPGRQVLFAHSGSLPVVDTIFANNIITGSSTLYTESVASLNPLRSQNIINGYTPSQSGFLVENPQLMGSSPQRLSSSSPAINNANTNYYSYVTDDMDGQTRSIPRDIGADEYYSSASFITRSPLTTNVVGPNCVDMELSVSPSSQTVNIGATNTSYTITVTSDAGFTSNVTLTVSGLLPGMSAGFNPPMVNGSGSVSLNVTNTSAVLGGNYPFIITATSSNLASSTTVTLQVGRTPSNLRWAGTSTVPWLIQDAAIWFNISSNAADGFYNGDSVLFDDTAGVETNITIPAGLAVSPSVVTNNSSTNNFTISGAGEIIGRTKFVKMGTGTLTLSTTNDFGGGMFVSGGTLKAGNPYALGGQSGFIILTNGGTLDVNGNNLGMDAVLVSGAGVSNNGAIINSGVSVYPALAVIELAGNTTIGGLNRWDLRAANGNQTASLSTSGNAYTLTKVGTNFIGIASVTIDPNLGNISVQGGTLDIEGTTTSLGNPSSTLTVSSNATLELYNTVWATNQMLSKVFVLNDGAVVQNGSGNNYFLGPVTLNGNDHFNIGSTSLTFSNKFSGSGNLIKTGSGTLNLSGTNSCTGSTTVSNGILGLMNNGSISGSATITVASGATLDASGRGDTTLTLAAGQTLTGNGTVKGNVIVGNGATLAPGGSLTTLTFNNSLTLNGGSATVMEVSKSPTTNDAAQVAGTLTYGGTLVITNISAGAFSAGDSFKLFNAAGYSGAFTNIVPVIPAVNLAWNTNNLGAGILSVVSSPTSPPKIGAMTASGNNFIFSGSNGVQNWTYYLLASTNLALPLTNWTAIATNTFDSGGNFNLTNPLTPNVPQAFYLLKLQ